MSALALLLLLAVENTKAEPVQPPKKDPVICTRGRDLTFGSHMSASRVCKRKSEWAEEAKNARRELKSMNERGNNPTEIRGAKPIE